MSDEAFEFQCRKRQTDPKRMGRDASKRNGFSFSAASGRSSLTLSSFGLKSLFVEGFSAASGKRIPNISTLGNVGEGNWFQCRKRQTDPKLKWLNDLDERTFVSVPQAANGSQTLLIKKSAVAQKVSVPQAANGSQTNHGQ